MPATKNARHVESQVSKLKSATIRQWRQWAADLAAGRAGPDPIAVLEAGRILELADAGRTLDQDVLAIREIEAAQARVAREREEIEKSLEPYGGQAGLAAEIQRRRHELKQLEGAANPWRWTSVGHSEGRVLRMRNANPRLWGDV
jgi:hypothetical protein